MVERDGYRERTSLGPPQRNLPGRARAPRRHGPRANRPRAAPSDRRRGPFVVCDRRRLNLPASVLSPMNRTSGISARRAARGGSLCIHRVRMPHNLSALVTQVRSPCLSAQLIVCAPAYQALDAFTLLPAPFVGPRITRPKRLKCSVGSKTWPDHPASVTVRLMATPSPGWAELLHARLNSLADEWKTATSHPGLLGGAREKAVAELLRGLMPRRFEVLDGALAVVDANDNPIVSSDQYDIVVADTWRYPCLFRIGSTAILPPEAARLVFEVKSQLTNPLAHPKNKPETVTTGTSSFADAMTHLGALGQHARVGEMSASRILFSYRGCQASTLCDWLKDLLRYREDPVSFDGKVEDRDKLSSGAMPEVLAILDHGVYAWKTPGPAYAIICATPAEVLAQVLRDALARVSIEDRPPQAATSIDENFLEAPLLQSVNSMSLRFGQDLRQVQPSCTVALEGA